MKTVSVVEIASKAKVDPRVARARLRRALKDRNTKVPRTVERGSWVFAARDAQSVRKIIT